MINSILSDTGSGHGTFTLVGVNPDGIYLLTTIGRSGILDVREIKLPRKDSVTINLSHPNPPKRDVH